MHLSSFRGALHLASFEPSLIGSGPSGNIAITSNGNIYGTSFYGGNPTYSYGRVWGYDKSTGGVQNLVDCSSVGYLEPNGGLTNGGNGLFYGTTFRGGSNNAGCLFSWSPSTGFQVLAGFGGAFGSNPLGSVTIDSNGNLYGTTRNGGQNSLGTVWEYTSGGQLKVIGNFTGTNGKNPSNPDNLVVDRFGNVFGATIDGGANGNGSVYEIVKDSGLITQIASFSPGVSGSGPFGLAIDGSGNLYGSVNLGGPQNRPLVFELSQTAVPEPNAIILLAVGLATSPFVSRIARERSRPLASRAG